MDHQHASPLERSALIQEFVERPVSALAVVPVQVDLGFGAQATGPEVGELQPTHTGGTPLHELAVALDHQGSGSVGGRRRTE